MEIGSMATIIIAGVITVCFVAAIKRVVRNALNGKCSGGCSGSCQGCQSCNEHKHEIQTSNFTKL